MNPVTVMAEPVTIFMQASQEFGWPSAIASVAVAIVVGWIFVTIIKQSL